jgi:Cytochrome c3
VGVNTCADCHATLGGAHTDITSQWQRSIHSERDVTCADCHGGDPSATTKEAAMSPAAGYVGVPAKSAIPALCASCHADVELMRQYNLPTDQFAKYNESVHGKLLAEGDTNVTTCFDCHGGHQVLKANDPASTVYPANVPALCAKCHSDKDLMAPYNIPTDQLDLYSQSVHGHALLDKQDFRAPTCATCHGTHGATPPGVTEVANVCGSCHGATQDYYLKSAHAGGGDAAPKCVTCHGPHDVSQPTDALLVGTEPGHCDACHSPDSTEGKVAKLISDAFDSTTKAYADAENTVKSAQQLGMLVTQQESELQQANTGIITARAAQHTLDSEAVLKSLEDARKAVDGAKAGAENAISQSILRRRAMVIAVAAIALTIVALYLLKRFLDRRLKEET